MKWPPRQILLPALSFAVLLALALVAVHRADRTPRGTLYQRLGTYLEAVESGDARGAAAVAPEFDASALADHVESLQGLVGHIQSVAVSDDGHGGEVHLAWLDSQGYGRRVEVLDWVQEGPEGWLLARIEVVR